MTKLSKKIILTPVFVKFRPKMRFKKHLFQMEISSSTPPILPRIGGGTLFICISTKNWSWEKFLHWKLPDYICSSGLKKIYQTKSHTCDLKKFSVRIFPIFEHFWKDLNICGCECTRFPIAYLTKLYVVAVSPIKILETNQKKRDDF